MGYRSRVARVWLAVWLALFTAQSADLVAILLPDECGIATAEDAGRDPCPDGCVRCVCCARVAVTVTAPDLTPGSEVALDPLPFIGRLSLPHPHGILHVPKAL
jgi:hypothetical protein